MLDGEQITAVAEVTTASVSVCTLNIGGKQMTLAMFRQIPELYDKSYTDGKPLGWVRYPVNVPHTGKKHTNWLITERNGDLYRLPINELFNTDDGNEMGLKQLYIAT